MDSFLRGLATAICMFVGLESCGPQPIETGPLVVSNDFSGLTDEERRADEWAALSLTVPPEGAARLNSGAFTNVLLTFFPCPAPSQDAYLALGYLDGRIVTAEVLEGRRPGPAVLTFYLPRNRREHPFQTRKSGDYDCAVFQSDGPLMSVYVSRIHRLPPDLEFRRLPPAGPSHRASSQ